VAGDNICASGVTAGVAFIEQHERPLQPGIGGKAGAVAGVSEMYGRDWLRRAAAPPSWGAGAYGPL